MHENTRGLKINKIKKKLNTPFHSHKSLVQWVGILNHKESKRKGSLSDLIFDEGETPTTYQQFRYVGRYATDVAWWSGAHLEGVVRNVRHLEADLVAAAEALETKVFCFLFFFCFVGL
ncbi:hypothetical protein ES332_A10G151800v1 [Gossypium tomentosum]|uniref:Uncharacterized protein n=1 Tax=Gossypium tomentosum TaxID=34277 RepID=A0A5D2NQ90_GOSTO|nr:hypothetical protein ES332_A10G151800v1 [Gossypium tomentosum]